MTFRLLKKVLGTQRLKSDQAQKKKLLNLTASIFRILPFSLKGFVTNRKGFNQKKNWVWHQFSLYVPLHLT